LLNVWFLLSADINIALVTVKIIASHSGSYLMVENNPALATFLYIGSIMYWLLVRVNNNLILVPLNTFMSWLLKRFDINLTLATYLQVPSCIGSY
jgi:hypothetical protein